MRRHQTVADRRLSVAGFVFRHGIGTHARSGLMYHLNGAFRTFDVLFGLDDEANRGQRVRFRILVDGHTAQREWRLRLRPVELLLQGFDR